MCGRTDKETEAKKGSLASSPAHVAGRRSWYYLNPGHLRAKPKPSRGHKAAASSSSQGPSGVKGEQEIKRTKKKEKHLRLQERCLLQTSKGKDHEPRRE